MKMDGKNNDLESLGFFLQLVKRISMPTIDQKDYNSSPIVVTLLIVNTYFVWYFTLFLHYS